MRMPSRQCGRSAAAMCRALPISVLMRRRSRRECSARGSEAGSVSSHSVSRILMRTFRQRAVAAEAGAERRHPPPAAALALGERRGEHEEHERAAQVAEAREQLGAAARVALFQPGRAAQALEHRAAAGVPDPGADVAALRGSCCSSPCASTRLACSPASAGTSRDRMLRSRPCRLSMRSLSRAAGSLCDTAPSHSHAAFVLRGTARSHDGGGAIAKEARAHQHAGIVVDVERGAAHLDADRQHVLARARAAARRRCAGWAARRRSPGRRGRARARRAATRGARRRSW